MGTIYLADLTNFQDDGQPRKALRSWQHPVSFSTQKVNYIDIQCATGVGVPPGTNPQLVLRKSLDEGQSWGPERYTSIGKPGETANDVRFRRLGSTDRGLNSGFAFELSWTDVFMPALMGAEIG